MTSPQTSTTARTAQTTPSRTALDLYSQLQQCIRNNDETGFRQLLDPKFRLTMPGTINVDTDKSVEVFFRGWLAAFSDYGQQQGSLTDFSNADGTQASVRESHTMTHDGEFQLSDGQCVAPSGRTVTIYTITNILSKDGKISKIDITYDALDLVHQLHGHDIRHGQPTRINR